MTIGYSTGAIFPKDIPASLELIKKLGFEAVELSVLRQDELQWLIDNWMSLDLNGFTYVSLHAPKFDPTNTSEG